MINDHRVVTRLFLSRILLTLPQDLLGEVQKISGAPTKSKAVVVALEEYIRDKRMNRLLSRRGEGFGLSLKQLLKNREENGS